MSRETIVPYAVSLGVAAGVWLAGWFLSRVLLQRVVRLSGRTKTDIDDLFLAAIRPHLPVWFAVLGVVLGVQRLALPERTLKVMGMAAEAIVVLSVSLLLARFLANLLERRAGQVPGMLPGTTLTRNVIRIGVVGLGVLVVAGDLGIEITPILTVLGVSSLAVALALQPTLSNLFAGFHLLIARQVRVGDYVELENGNQGYVTDIGWRSTQIRELPNNLIIIPNARLAEIVVKNYSLPEEEQSALVQVGVSYGSDLRRVERVTVDVARETLAGVAGGVPEFEPFIRYHTFGDSSIGFTVVLRVRQFADRYPVCHEFVKRLHARYADEGIEIPFPQRVLHVPGRVGVDAAGADVSGVDAGGAPGAAGR